MHVTGVHATSGTGAMNMNSASTDSVSAIGTGPTAQGVGLLTPTVATSVPKGFQLEYRQLPGNC